RTRSTPLVERLHEEWSRRLSAVAQGEFVFAIPERAHEKAARVVWTRGDATVETFVRRRQYRCNSCRGIPFVHTHVCAEAEYVAHLRADWPERVLARGIALVSGRVADRGCAQKRIFVLDAVSSTFGTDVVAVRVMTRDRGIRVTVRDGYVHVPTRTFCPGAHAVRIALGATAARDRNEPTARSKKESARAQALQLVDELMQRMPARGKHRELAELDSRAIGGALERWLNEWAGAEYAPRGMVELPQCIIGTKKMAVPLRIARALPLQARWCRKAVRRWIAHQRQLEREHLLRALDKLHVAVRDGQWVFDDPVQIKAPRLVNEALRSAVPFWIWAAPGALRPSADAAIAANLRAWYALMTQSILGVASLVNRGPVKTARVLWLARRMLPRQFVEARRELRNIARGLRAFFIDAIDAIALGKMEALLDVIELHFEGVRGRRIDFEHHLWLAVRRGYEHVKEWDLRARSTVAAAVEIANLDI
ncbi:MAG: hypothetical protein NZM12_03590, partial [Steroidobacteraceae bacterium]|nr:hypothetical protein [Steroidobacteraceae bacterium]